MVVIMEKVLASSIYKDLKLLKGANELSNIIADYVNTHETYTLAQIGQLIDEFYGNSCGLSIAEDITCLFGWKK